MPDVVFKNPFSGITSTGNIMNEHKGGVNSTGPYLKGGIPYVVSKTKGNGVAEEVIPFPSVAKKVTIVCTAGAVQLGGLSGENAWTLTAGAAGALSEITLNARIKQLRIKDTGGAGCTVLVLAELTGLDPADCPAWPWLTGVGSVGEGLNTANSEADNNARIP